MTLEEKIKQDMISAMKEKNKLQLSVIRGIKAAVDLEHINTKKDITDDLIIDVLNKQLKMRNDSIAEFEKASRQDLADKTKEEVVILMEYMPEQLTEEEVNTILDEAFNLLNPTGASDMGKVMKEVTPKLKGKADMKKVSNIIRERLG